MIDQKRFDELAAEHRIPGAVLAVAVGDEVTEFATGVLNVATGVETTTDSLFQLASITKPYTATMVMRLVGQGRLALDTRVVDVLPGFTLADREVAGQVTIRHLLTHMSGIAGDFFADTGRGDDALERYVAACADAGQDTALGATLSYSNTGYNILGRVVEVLTGTTWEQAVADLVTEPLGLTHTWALPEQVLRFRAAMGHRRTGEDQVPVPMWEPCPRSENPSGGLCATAGDVVAFARMHLDDPALAVMREPAAEVASPLADHWGLGWVLLDWHGRRVVLHTGDVMGQSGRVYIVPDQRVVAAVLTNTDASRAFSDALFGELFAELCGLRMPSRPEPPAQPVELGDPARYLGTYTRVGGRATVTASEDGGGLRFAYAAEGLMAEFIPPFEFPLVPVSDRLFVGRGSDEQPWTPVVIEDGYLHYGLRALRRIEAG